MPNDENGDVRRAIAFASDARGMLPLKVAVYSLLETAAPNVSYVIYVLGDHLGAAHRRELEELAGRFGKRHEVRLLPMENELEGRCLLRSDRWPMSAWSRLFLPSLIGDEWDRVLYCDIDVLFCDDLGELYATDLRGKTLAGTLDELPLRNGDVHPRLACLGVPAEAAGYFNSGVMLMDARAFRERRLLDRVLAYAPRYEKQFSFPDQDAINGALWDELVAVHPRWNWCDRWAAKIRKNDPSAAVWPGCATPREAVEATVNPGILHFWGPKKPWFYNYRFEGPRYEAAMRRADVGGLPLPGKTWSKRVKKMFYGFSYALNRRAVRRYAATMGVTR